MPKIPIPFRPQKLKILAFNGKKDADLSKPGEQSEPFEVMYNPASVQIEFKNQWQKPQGIGTIGVDLAFAATKPERIRFKLLLGGTSVDDVLGGRKLFSPTPQSFYLEPVSNVTQQVTKFLMVTTQAQVDTHAPCFLVLQWGNVFKRLKDSVSKDIIRQMSTLRSREFDTKLSEKIGNESDSFISYPCRLESVDVLYTQFDRGGNPLRAELDTVFIEDGKDQLEGGLQSPDVTHARTAKAGDSLPNMAEDIYEDASYYMKIAEANQLDSVRNISAGESISFPSVK